MRPASRSLNLSNAVAVACYEAWQQLAFGWAAGSAPFAGLDPAAGLTRVRHRSSAQTGVRPGRRGSLPRCRYRQRGNVSAQHYSTELGHLPIDKTGAGLLFRIISQRYIRGSIANHHQSRLQALARGLQPRRYPDLGRPRPATPPRRDCDPGRKELPYEGRGRPLSPAASASPSLRSSSHLQLQTRRSTTSSRRPQRQRAGIGHMPVRSPAMSTISQYSDPTRYVLEENAMRLSIEAAPAFAALAFFLLASGAAEARTTADQVVDDATLKAFVDGGGGGNRGDHGHQRRSKAQGEAENGGRLEGRIDVPHPVSQERGPVHPRERPLGGKTRTCATSWDDNGFRVVEELLAAAARGGGFVRYHDGEPKTAYAVEIHLRDHRKTICACRRLLAGRLPCPDPYRGSAQTRRHRIAGRGPRDPNRLRRGSGAGVPRRRPVRRLQRPRRGQKRLPGRRRRLEIGLRLLVGRERWRRHLFFTQPSPFAKARRRT